MQSDFDELSRAAKCDQRKSRRDKINVSFGPLIGTLRIKFRYQKLVAQRLLLFTFCILHFAFCILIFSGCSSPYLPIYSTSAPSFQLPVSSLSSLARLNNYVQRSNGSFIHNGFDFNTTQNLNVLAAAAGTVTLVERKLNTTSNNYQFNVRVRINDRYLNEYVFEPFTQVSSEADVQSAHINLVTGQHLAVGDVMGTVIPFASDGSAHVHFGVLDDDQASCPESYFSAANQAALLAFFQSSMGSSENLCAVR